VFPISSGESTTTLEPPGRTNRAGSW